MINLFNPIVFGFGADKEYQPGQARYITLFAQMFLFLVTSIYTLYVSRKTDGNTSLHHKTICISGIIMTVFIALQSLYPLLPFYAVGCLLASCMVHSFIYSGRLYEYARQTGTARQMAYRDPLTGVKNKLAYIEALQKLEIRLDEGSLKEFGVVVFDLNGLKKVNDTLGHDAGDEYIKSASSLICVRFKHSPVFRIGGDEFVVILEGDDYRERAALLEAFDLLVEENMKNGLVVVSSGCDIYDPDSDESYNDVFKRADRKMYERKSLLKQMAAKV